MNGEKQQYIAYIRANSSYPTYRGIIGLIAILGYILAALVGLSSLVTGLSAMMYEGGFLMALFTIMSGAVATALGILMVRFYKEAALILADIGDAVTDQTSRSAGP